MTLYTEENIQIWGWYRNVDNWYVVISKKHSLVYFLRVLKFLHEIIIYIFFFLIADPPKWTMSTQTLLTDHCSIKIKPTPLRDPNSNKNRKKREGQKDKRTERQKTERQKDRKIGRKILFNCNLVKSLSLMTLHSRAFNIKLTPSTTYLESL